MTAVLAAGTHIAGTGETVLNVSPLVLALYLVPTAVLG